MVGNKWLWRSILLAFVAGSLLAVGALNGFYNATRFLELDPQLPGAALSRIDRAWEYMVPAVMLLLYGMLGTVVLRRFDVKQPPTIV